jgi:5-methylcytosine-specific restriction enzyme subunit McrC
MSYDVLHNQILRTTLRRLAATEGVSTKNANRMRALLRRFEGVHDVEIGPEVFSKVQVGANARFYLFLMDVCRLVHEGLLTEERTGRRRFRDFTRDDREMGLLFEAFVRNFLKLRLGGSASVSRPNVKWFEARSARRASLALLPALETDTMVRWPETTLIVETKFTKSPFVTRRGGRAKLRSEHLRQVFAYVHHYSQGHANERVEGMLLYAQVSQPFDHRFLIDGYPIRVVSLDLAQHWTTVESDLLGVIRLHSRESGRFETETMEFGSDFVRRGGSVEA